MDCVVLPARYCHEFTDGGPAVAREHVDIQRLFGSRARHAISRLQSGGASR